MGGELDAELPGLGERGVALGGGLLGELGRVALAGRGRWDAPYPPGQAGDRPGRRLRRLRPLRQLVLQALAAVIAKALGYHHKTTTRLVTEVGGTWSRYAPTITHGDARTVLAEGCANLNIRATSPDAGFVVPCSVPTSSLDASPSA